MQSGFSKSLDNNTLLPPSQALNQRGVLTQHSRAATIQEMEHYSTPDSIHKFIIGELYCFADTSIRSEVLKSRVNSLPLTAKWFLGVINLRGNLIPIFSLYELFRQQEVSQGDEKLLIIFGENLDLFGIEINDVSITSLDSSYHLLNHIPEMNSAAKSYISESYQWNNNFLLKLDVIKLVTDLKQSITHLSF